MNGFRGGSAWKRAFIFSAPPCGISRIPTIMPVGRQLFSEFEPGPQNFVFILASLFCLFVASSIGQEPIRVKVRLVNVAFSARDSRGALVQN
jgi:hypothetical protein